MPRQKAPSPVAAFSQEQLVQQIWEDGASRRYIVGQQTRTINSLKAFLRLAQGWDTTLPEADRNKVKKIAQEKYTRYEKYFEQQAILSDGGKLRANVERVELDADELTFYMTRIKPWLLAMQNFSDYREVLEARMRDCAEHLAVYSTFVEPIKGFASLGLALIIAETGDLSNYDGPAKVWKRMGLAVINGERQGCGLTGNAEKAILHGYNKSRRSTSYKMGDSMLKSKRHGGKYTTLYETYKAQQAELHPDWADGSVKGGPMRLHLRAQRRMEKEVIKDLWKAWKAAAQPVATPTLAKAAK